MNDEQLLFIEHDEVEEVSDSPHCGTCMPEASADVEVTDAPHCGGCY